MKTDVLHIRSAPVEGSAADRMEARLGAGMSPVAVCGDVYHGLARLVRRRGEWAPVVLVCVDDLSPAEMEFFRITARSLPGTDVYVYGAERLAKRVAGAIERGASGEVTDDFLRKLSIVSDPTPAVASNTGDTPVSVSEILPGSSKTRRVIENTAHADSPFKADAGQDFPPAVAGVVAPPAATQTESDEGEPAEAPPPTGLAAPDMPERLPDPSAGEIPCGPISETHETVVRGNSVDAVSRPVESSTPVTDDNPDDDADGDADSSGSAGRVPWLRYDNVPVRKAPSREGPLDSSRQSTGTPTPPSLREPLLSEEELRALIGDDVAAIGPDDDDDEAVQGGSKDEGNSR